MQYLNQSLTINGVTLNNRLVMPPMATEKSTPDGGVSDALCQYYLERAKDSKIGLIITEHSYVNKQGKASKGQLSIASDDDLEGLKKLAEAIHVGSTKAMAQINHVGGATSSVITGQIPVAPSVMKHPNPSRPFDVLPREATNVDIVRIIQDFADAAYRAKIAGFDGVEIHAAHGHLLGQFYSPLTNHRTDEYGADCLENRIRLHLQVLAAVRNAVGRDYPVALRFGGCDYREGGSTIADAVQASKIFEQAGVDLLDISGGIGDFLIPGRTEPGWFQDMTLAIKQAVSLPVLLTGGITTVQQVEGLLEKGTADLIGVGRALLKDARWATKAMQEASRS